MAPPYLPGPYHTLPHTTPPLPTTLLPLLPLPPFLPGRAATRAALPNCYHTMPTTRAPLPRRTACQRGHRCYMPLVGTRLPTYYTACIPLPIHAMLPTTALTLFWVGWLGRLVACLFTYLPHHHTFTLYALLQRYLPFGPVAYHYPTFLPFSCLPHCLPTAPTCHPYPAFCVVPSLTSNSLRPDMPFPWLREIACA